MIYDVDIGNEEFNYTYNVSPMFYAAIPGGGLKIIHGMTGREVIDVLLEMNDFFHANKMRLIDMEPDNGWGGYSGAMEFMHDIIGACLRNPDAICDIS